MAGMQNCNTIFYNGIERPLTERKRMTAQDREAILKALSDGESVASVAARFARPKALIYRMRAQTVGDSERLASKLITVRLMPGELRALDDMVAQTGLTRSKLLRVLIRAGTGFATVPPNTTNDWLDWKETFIGISRNFNQMTKAANAGKLLWTRLEQERVSEIARETQVAIRRINAFILAAQKLCCRDPLSADNGWVCSIQDAVNAIQVQR